MTDDDSMGCRHPLVNIRSLQVWIWSLFPSTILHAISPGMGTAEWGNDGISTLGRGTRLFMGCRPSLWPPWLDLHST